MKIIAGITMFFVLLIGGAVICAWLEHYAYGRGDIWPKLFWLIGFFSAFLFMGIAYFLST